MNKHALPAVAAAVVLLSSLLLAQQADPRRPGTARASAAALTSLPDSLRERGAAILRTGDERARAQLAGALSRDEPQRARRFLLARLEADPSPAVRRAIVDRLGRVPHPDVERALERRVTRDADAGIALLALERLRGTRMQTLRGILQQRLTDPASRDDEKARAALIDEEERRVARTRGTMLPGFMRQSPPVFSLAPEDRAVRVLAFGDYGTGLPAQRDVAAAMQRYHAGAAFDFGITLGDNFYSVGMLSPRDPRWKAWWDALYDPIGIRIYASMGNHDWGHPDSPVSELLYAAQSPSWRMPAPYYTFTAGPAQFFALDTNDISERQLQWLRGALDASRARWRIVYGHHPIFSAGVHDDTPGFAERLLPVIRDKADLFLAGHEHDLQHLGADGRVQFVISGGGGAGIRPAGTDPRLIWTKSSYGFSVIEASAAKLTVRFVDTELTTLHEFSVPGESPTALQLQP